MILILMQKKIPNMIFETYDSTKHTLEVGTKIRLAGREGEIIKEETDTHVEEVYFRDRNEKAYMNLAAFPGLEIAISPLTIDKRVKSNILNKLIFLEIHANDRELGRVQNTLNSIFDYLNSLEET